MLRHKKVNILFSLLIGAAIFLIGCEGGENALEGGENLSSGTPGNIVVTIDNPSFDGLYSRNDPELIFTVTEGNDDTSVPDERLAASVFDQIDDTTPTDDSPPVDDTRQNEQIVEDLHSGVRIPTVADGSHMMAFVVRDEEGNPLVTVEIPFHTDTSGPSISLSSPVDGSIGNVDTPTLTYEASDDATVSVTLDEQLIETVSGQPLPTVADGAHILEVTARDTAGNTASALAVYTVVPLCQS